MDIPTWAYDEHLSSATEGALKLGLALYRFGSPQVDSRGHRRAYWRGTKPQLARVCRVSKRTVDAAVTELTNAGLVTLHRSTVPTAGIALSAYVSRPEPHAEFAPVAESETDPHAADRSIPSVASDRSSSTSAATHEDPADSAPLLERLAAAGVRSPSTWLADFGADRCDLALSALAQAEERGEIRNPAGFMHRLLTTRAALSAPAHPRAHDHDSHRAHYVGQFEHLLRRNTLTSRSRAI